MQDTANASSWPVLSRLAFRFAFAYFALAFFSAILGLVPVLAAVGAWHDEAVQPFYVWIGKTVFGVEITVFPNGSGDTTYNWVQFASHLAFAAAVAAAWSVIDRRRTAYPWLKDGLWIAMRFVLASAMLGYGINKVFGLQFPEPGMQRLLQSYGDSSPMGLMWTFMGASQPYTMFAGWMETIGGLLLCFRRTQLVGALWVAGVMTNVFVLNMCYDIPVKIYSFHLLALALVIAAPDVPRLLRIFLLNRAVPRADQRGPWTNRTVRRVGFGVKLAWILFTVSSMSLELRDMVALYGPDAPKGEFDGTWEVRELRRDGAEMPPVVTDAVRWRHLTVIDRPEWSQVIATPMKGVPDRWRLAKREGGVLELRAMTVAAGDDASKAELLGTLTAVREGERVLRVAGSVEGVRIEAVCDLLDAREFPLMQRGFHWINEYPFNR